MVKLSVGEFKWSAAEQIYPFEKDIQGKTLYCKEIDFGNMPNAGNKSVAHNVAGWTTASFFKMDVVATNAGANVVIPIPRAFNGSDATIDAFIDGNNISITDWINYSASTVVVRLTYRK